MIILETERLILRTWCDDDFDIMLSINQNPHVMEFFPELQGPEKTASLLHGMREQQEKRGYSWYAVVVKQIDTIIGAVGLNYTDFPCHFSPSVEIGWRLDSLYWGKGYATEAAKAVLKYAFETLNLPEIVSFTASANSRSIQVMKNIGLEHDNKDDFNHPYLEEDSPLKSHVLFRLSRERYNSKHHVYKTYDKISKWFDEHRCRDLIEKHYLNIISHSLKPESDILDLGCGMGEPIARYFVHRGHYITGVDGSHSQISLATKRYPEQKWIVADMRRLEINKKFDCILAWHSLFHLPQEDQVRMFTVFSQLAKPGAWLAFTSGEEKGECWGENGGQPLYHASLAESEYRQILSDNNFSVVECNLNDPSCGNSAIWLAKKSHNAH